MIISEQVLTPVMLYGAEGWKLTATDKGRIEAADLRLLIKISHTNNKKR